MGFFSRKKNEAAVLPDIQDMEYWERLSEGDILILNDIQSIEKSVHDGEGANSINYKVTETCFIKHADGEMNETGVCMWFLARLERTGADDLILLIKKVEDCEPEARVYYQPMVGLGDERTQLVPTGNRQDLIEAGHGWVFDVDGEVEDVLDLEYTSQITYSPDGEGEAVFQKKSFGEQLGNAYNNLSDEEPEFLASIVEYLGDEKTNENPEALFLELGDAENDLGGEIVLYFGVQIPLSDINMLDT